jgi:hypothetical protein
MGNLRQKYTTEEWDEMVDSTKPGFVEKRIEQSIQEAAEKYVESLNLKVNVDEYKEYAINDFTAGAKWMMENIQINLRRVK